MTKLIYSIPVGLASSCPGRPVILRADNPAALSVLNRKHEDENILYIRLRSLGQELIPDLIRKAAIPIDYVLSATKEQASGLYKLSALLPEHQVRVTIPMLPGFSKTVKLAAALNFAVKLDISAPYPGLIDELTETINAYLHQTTVCQPVEFFHSLLIYFLHNNPTNLWLIQEEDPAAYRFITADGQESMPGRLADSPFSGLPETFVSRFREEMRTTDRECGNCAFLDCCACYFKWPDRNFSCEQYRIREMFALLQQAANEITRDQDEFEQTTSCQPGESA